MSLRIRRGTNAERLQTTLDLGEIAYTTDSKQLYVGDGVTAGGNNILSTSAGTGLAWNNLTQKFDLSSIVLSTSDISEGTNLYYTPDRAQDATSTLFTHTEHTGISFTYDGVANKIFATVSSGLEDIQDDVSDMFLFGTHSGISYTYNDVSGVINSTVTISSEIVQDSIAPMFVNGQNTGITFTYDDDNNVIDSEVNVFPVDSPGLLYNNGIGILEWTNQIVELDTAPMLGGDLDLGFNDITGSGNISITGSVSCSNSLNIGTLIDPEFTVSYAAGAVSLLTNTGVILRTDAPRFYVGGNTSSSRLYVISYNDPDANAVILRSFNSTSAGNSISLFRARGDGDTPVAVQQNDAMHKIIYSAYDGTNISTKAIEISATVDGTVSAGAIPGKLEISTANASGAMTTALTIDSTQLLTAAKGLSVTSNYIKFPVYADSTARNTALPDPEAGMVVFLTDRGSSNPGLQVNTDSTTAGWVDL